MEEKWTASRLGGGMKEIIPIIKDTRQRHWNPTTASEETQPARRRRENRNRNTYQRSSTVDKAG